mgnify:CR=1 FL=1
MLIASEEQIAANRSNAKKSKGPRSIDGKIRSSENATRHGLTSRVDEKQLSAWYRSILISLPHEVHGTISERLGEAALRLAEAEARLERLRSREEALARKISDGEDEQNEWMGMLELFDPDHADPVANRLRQDLCARSKARLCDELRLVRRYIGEAEAARARAFSDSIVASSGIHELPETNPSTS